MDTSIRPLLGHCEGWYYDGFQPARHAAIVELDSAGIRISCDGREAMAWSYGEIRIAADGLYGDPVRIERRSGPPGETLGFDRPGFLESLRQHAPELFAGEPALHLSGWPAVLFSCVVLAVAILLLYTWGVPWMTETAARFTPVFLEERLGQAVVNVLAPTTQRCSNRPSQEVLDKIVARLAAAAGPGYRFQVVYVDGAMVNAFAAPGGYIVVFRGLLQQMETPEEFAGVMAHEMQHVLHKHGTRAVARQVSGATLLSLLVGGGAATPAAVEGAAGLINLHYQRADEDAADRGSVPLLAKAGISPHGLPAFLRRLRLHPSFREAPSKYLSTHPAMVERTARLEAEVGRIPKAPALLSTEEWVAARKVCRP